MERLIREGKITNVGSTRQEVRPYNIRTTIIFPGAVASELPDSITDPDIGPAMSRFCKETAISADSFARMVMFAMSQVDQKKFLQLKEGLAAGFGQSDNILDGNPSIQDQPGVSAMGPIAPNLSSQDLTAEQAKMVNDAVQQGMQQQLDSIPRLTAQHQQLLQYRQEAAAAAAVAAASNYS